MDDVEKKQPRSSPAEISLLVGVVISHSSDVEIFPVLELPLGHPDLYPGLGFGGRFGLPGERVLLEVQGLQFGRRGHELDVQTWRGKRTNLTSVPLLFGTLFNTS